MFLGGWLSSCSYQRPLSLSADDLLRVGVVSDDFGGHKQAAAFSLEAQYSTRLIQSE